MSETEKRIISLLYEIRPYESINTQTRLLEEGILDSMAILAFITLMEDEYDMEVPDDSITRANFETVGAIVSLLSNCVKEK